MAFYGTVEQKVSYFQQKQSFWLDIQIKTKRLIVQRVLGWISKRQDELRISQIMKFVVVESYLLRQIIELFLPFHFQSQQPCFHQKLQRVRTFPLALAYYFSLLPTYKYLLELMLGDVFDPKLELAFNLAQLSAYLLILGLAVFKLIRAVRHSQQFLIKFYICVLCIIAIELGIQSYQVSAQVKGEQPKIYILVIVNLYGMCCESTAIFFLADYWHETKEIISKESTQLEIKQKRHWVRLLAISLWLLVYTAYITYAAMENKFETQLGYHMVLTLGFQGMGATFMIWAILLQIMSGKRLAKALGSYEEWMNHISIQKVQFRCLYWVTSLVNIARISILLTVTIIIQILSQHIEWEWLAAYVYTGSNCAVLLVYLLGFSTKSVDQDRPTTLLTSGMRDSRLSNFSRDSKHETELSQSISDHSKQ